MTAMVLTHEVTNLDEWLTFGDKRRQLFSQFSSSHRVFIDRDRNTVSLVVEDADVDKFLAMHNSEEVIAIRAAAGVVEPVAMYFLEDGA